MTHTPPDTATPVESSASGGRTARVAHIIGCRRWGSTSGGAASWIVPTSFDGSPGRHIVHVDPGRRPYSIDDLLSWLTQHSPGLRYGRTPTAQPPQPNGGYWVAEASSDTPIGLAPSLIAACEIAITALANKDGQ